MIEAVLFDVGDTLLHFETSKAAEYLDSAVRPAYERLCELGLDPPSYEKYSRRIRRAFLMTYVWSRIRRREARLVRAFTRAHLRMGLRVEEKDFNDLALRCALTFRRFFSTDTEAQEVLARLDAAGFKLGIVSNTMFPGFAIDDALASEGLLKHLPVRIYSSDARYMKPHRRIFLLALDRIGVAPGRTLFVGDRMDKDVAGASRVGMKTALLVKNGRIPGGRPRPDHIIRRLSELPVILNA
jgi:putative hydrolase of the HAD superfamily